MAASAFTPIPSLTIPPITIPIRGETPSTTRSGSPCIDIKELCKNVSKIRPIFFSGEDFPRVFLGGNEARHSDLLKEHKITHIVQLCKEEEICGERTFDEKKKGIEVFTSDIEDNMAPSVEKVRELLDPIFERTLELLKDKTNRIFVHCHMGISRSPAFVMVLISRFCHITTAREAKNVLKDNSYDSEPNTAILDAYFPITLEKIKE
jgi:predicted protein tyrosine phosphatase